MGDGGKEVDRVVWRGGVDGVYDGVEWWFCWTDGGGGFKGWIRSICWEKVNKGRRNEGKK